jgi:FMN phosphatase YigB (HAD superfamily)
MLKISAVLFDLDNTLIFFDEREFFSRYMKSVHRYFSDILSYDEMRTKFREVTFSMLNKPGDILNGDYFIKNFITGNGLKAEDCETRFRKYYDEEFDSLSALVTFQENLHEMIVSIKDAGYKLVIATNPLWPEDVQIKRLAWAGLDNIHFDLITHAYNMHYIKPSWEYYWEIAEMIKLPPDECIMVGNDIVNDMAAISTGMKGFLVEGPDVKKENLPMSKEIREKYNFSRNKPDLSGDILKVSKLLGIE